MSESISPPQVIRWTGISHVGHVRKNNEDAFLGLIFDGKDDPNIIVLKIQPDTVALRGTKDAEVLSIDLN